MSILTRYILREFLIPLSYCLTGFLGIYVLFELFGSFSRLIGSDMSLAECVLYFGGYLSPFFHYLASAAMMLATLYTMWNFCRHSELTAMRASGISLLAVVKPLLFSGIIMGALVAWVSECYMPRYAQWAKRLRTEKFDADKAMQADGFAYRNTRENRTWTIKGAANRDCSELTDVFVVQDRSDGSRLMSVTAKKASYLDGEWWFFSPEVKYYDINSRPCPSPNPEIDNVPLRSFALFRESPEDIFMQNCDPALISVKGKSRYATINNDLTDASQKSLKYDAWAQALAPLSCIIVTLFTIPAGITSGRQAVFAGILGSIGMFFAFNGLSVACMVLAKTQLLPPVCAAIIPLLAFLCIGVYFFSNTLKATLRFMCVIFVAFAVYVALSAFFEMKCSLGNVWSFILAAPLPLFGIVAAAFKLREPS